MTTNVIFNASSSISAGSGYGFTIEDGDDGAFVGCGTAVYYPERTARTEHDLVYRFSLAPPAVEPDAHDWTCPNCGTVNLHEQRACGAGEWNGCGVERP